MAEHIDPSGDVILVVGIDDPPTRFRVSSVALSKSSAIFKAMFSGRFAAGRTMSSALSEDILLPDDDVETMRILLNIVHHENHNVPLALDGFAEILRMAKLVDKYDLAKTTRLACCLWFMKFNAVRVENSVGIFELTQLVTAAYLCENHCAFRLYTRILARDHRWTVGGLLGVIDDEAIPTGTLLRGILSLDKQRNDAFQVLEAEMVLFSESSCTCFTSCGCARENLSQVKSWLRETTGKDEFVGQKQVLFKEVLHQLSIFKLFNGVPLPAWIKKLRMYCWSAHEELARRIAAIDQAACRGLCLACLREGKDNSEDVCLEHRED